MTSIIFLSAARRIYAYFLIAIRMQWRMLYTISGKRGMVCGLTVCICMCVCVFVSVCIDVCACDLMAKMIQLK